MLAWCNRSPWWSWALLGTLLAALGVTAPWWLRGRALLQVAWLLAGTLVSTTAVLAYPPAQNRIAGGTDPQPSALVSTREGPVRGVLNDERTVEIFADIAYARLPVGDLRRSPPQPPEPRSEVFTADRFSDVPVQGHVPQPVSGQLGQSHPQHLAQHEARLGEASRARLRSGRGVHDESSIRLRAEMDPTEHRGVRRRPDQVTIAGESPPAARACAFWARRHSLKGWWTASLPGSGACMGTAGSTEKDDQADTRAAAEDAGRRLSENLGDASVEEMRKMSVKRILDAAKSLDAHWRPSIDGHLLDRPPAEIYASGEQLDVPILLGSNADEASLALASPPDTDADKYQESVRKTYGADAERFLRLYPGEDQEQVLKSRLQADTDKIMTRAMQRWVRLQTQTGESDACLYYFTRVPPERPREVRRLSRCGGDVRL
ncbi:carboxylesterase family protein [Streptomyces sp. NPDC059679]|uniref:carboxylesterase family protein n=1 Tax=Streptomyces sp. NPDC059679 TaxID=3346903 RepID=UPI0036941D0F